MSFPRYFFSIQLIIAFILFSGCNSSEDNNKNENSESGTSSGSNNYVYPSYEGLVMAGYQGWFAAEGDASERGWYHYQKQGQFQPGQSTIDFWPDVSDYPKTYKTSFRFSDGTPASVFSSYDEKAVDLHFKWMKDYGIDGVFLQRFVTEIKSEKGKRHFNKVLSSALRSARKYGRAVSVMYDLSGCTFEDMDVLVRDWKELQDQYALFDTNENPTYLRHNGKPLLAIWGAGFNDGRQYGLDDVNDLIEELKKLEHQNSFMLGIPYFWRTLGNDTENNPLLHSIIKKCDIILPWAVGRYDESSYNQVAGETLSRDLAWCKRNGVDYVPLVFPGFSWGNLQDDPDTYELIPRNKGDFFWKQIAGAKNAGAESLYVAMFDEVDEGTAIFKCLRDDELPLNGEGKFVGIDSGLESDYYLWLTGEAAKWMRTDDKLYSSKPKR